MCNDPSAVLMKLEDDGHGLFDLDEDKKETKRSANDGNGKSKDTGQSCDSNGASSSSAKVLKQDPRQPPSGADDDNASDNLVDSDDEVAKTTSNGSATAPSHSSTAKSTIASPGGLSAKMQSKGKGSSGGGRLLKGRLSKGGHADDLANDDDEEEEEEEEYNGAFDGDKQRILEVAASGKKNNNKELIDLSEEALELIADNQDYGSNFVRQSQRSRRISSAISQPQEPRLKKLKLLSATKAAAPGHERNAGSSYEMAASIEDSDDNGINDAAVGSEGSSEGDLSSSDDVFFRHAQKKKRKIAKKGGDTKAGKHAKTNNSTAKAAGKSMSSQQRSKGIS